MTKVLLSSSIAFLIVFLAIPIIIRVAEEKKLYDIPDERKIHKDPIASLGGIAMFAGFILAVLIAQPFNLAYEFQYIVAGTAIIFFLGLKDDIIIISPSKKFLGQLLATFVVIYLGGLRIQSMHGFLGLDTLPYLFSTALTYFTMLLIINSFNLIDGVDGLAGSLGLLTTLIFGVYFYMENNLTYSILSFSMSGSIAGFLIYNRPPARIFMGDTGAMLIGMINAILVVKFIEFAPSVNAINVIKASPAVGFAILMVPLFDTLRVFSIRILSRRSPFTPDKNHIHHMLLDRGWKPVSVTLFCVFINFAFAAYAFWAQQFMSCTWLILSLVAMGFAGIGILYFSTRKLRVVHNKIAEEYEDKIHMMGSRK
jgi:UDP-N-acetylmuramyl pentapeptide phosphotransferase/UDP-N-acetylglucosamine-1-phosphate transferase